MQMRVLLWVFALLLYAQVPASYAREIEPHLRVSLDLGATANSLDIQGSRAYIATASALKIADISNLASPQILRSLPLSSPATVVRVVGDFAYLAGRNLGLKIVDIRNPASPAIVGQYAFPASNLAIAGPVVYMVSADGGAIQVLDVTDPANPTPRTPISNISSAKLASNGSLLASIGAGPGATTISVFNIADPFNPVPVSEFTRVPANAMDSFTTITMRGQTLFASYITFAFCCEGMGWVDSSQLLSIDVSDPAVLTAAGGVITYGQGNLGNILCVGEYAILSDKYSQWRLIEVQASNRLVQSSVVPSSALAVDAEIIGEHALLLSGSNLSIYHLATANPRSASITPVDGTITAFAGGPQVAYVGLRNSGLAIFDTRNPESPRRLSQTANFSAAAFLPNGEHLYVATPEGLFTFKVQNPAQPLLTSHTPGRFLRLVREGSKLFAISDEPGSRRTILAFDLTDPAAPILSPAPLFIEPFENAIHLEVFASYAGRVIFGLRTGVQGETREIDAATGAQTGSWFPQKSGLRLRVIGNRGYRLFRYPDNYRNAQGFEILNLDTPLRPVVVGTFDTGDTHFDHFEIIGKYAYFEYAGNLFVLDLTDPSRPRAAANNGGLVSANLFESTLFASDGRRLLLQSAASSFAVVEPYPQIRLSSALNGLTVDGAVGITGRLQRSSDLAAWADLGPFTFTTDPTIVSEFPLDPPPAFYRFVVP